MGSSPTGRIDMNKETGHTYETLVEDLLVEHSPYTITRQMGMGTKPNNKTKHRVDIFIHENREVLSLKYQRVVGTAEEKIPYEVLVLQNLVSKGRCDLATIVLAGEESAWTQKEWYLTENFCTNMGCPDVRIITHEEFVNEYTTETIVENKGLWSD